MAKSIKIGKFKINAFVDFTPDPFNPTDFFPDVPIEDWDKHKSQHPLNENGKFQTNFGFFSIQSNNCHVLVDTGIGGAPGRLPHELKARGISTSEITTVVNTHLHGDHVGWNLTNGVPTFPNARYVISEVDWQYWTNKNVLDKSPHIKAQAIPLKQQNLVDLSNDGYKVSDGLHILSTPGHTPGHQSLLVESDGEKAIVTGDVIHSLAQITEPDWCAGFDMDKPAAIATRRKIIEQAITENLTLAAGHLLIGTNLGEVVEIKGKRYWKAL